MRKFLFAAAAGALISFTSCNNSGSSTTGTDPDVQKNLDASHTIDAAYRTGDVSKIDSVVSPDFMDHTDRGDKKGIDSLKAGIKMIHTMFTNMTMETKSEIANKDYVFSWMEFKGTNPTDQMGMPKGPFDMHAMEIAKYKDGKCVEHWEYVDPIEMMKMMAPQQNSNMKMDSTSKK